MGVETELITEKPIEQWTYAGMRVSSDGKRCSGWLDSTDEIRLYAEPTSSFVLGGIYDVVITQTGLRRGTPKYTGRRLAFDDPLLSTWRVAQLDAEQVLARNARERKDKNGTDALEEAMQPLIALAKSCRTEAQRAALIADVIYRMNTSWWRKDKR